MHSLVEAYGMLATVEMEITTSHSKIPEIETALEETVQHVIAAQASLKTALTFNR